MSNKAFNGSFVLLIAVLLPSPWQKEKQHSRRFHRDNDYLWCLAETGLQGDWFVGTTTCNDEYRANLFYFLQKIIKHKLIL